MKLVKTDSKMKQLVYFFEIVISEFNGDEHSYDVLHLRRSISHI